MGTRTPLVTHLAEAGHRAEGRALAAAHDDSSRCHELARSEPDVFGAVANRATISSF
jgi:hypothetical protein